MNNDITLKLFQCGYCVHPEKIAVKDGSWKKVKFPALVGLIHHPEHGYILFDTGYAEHFFQATRHFPYSLYPKITPVYFNEEESIKAQLEEIGISSSEISYIIISHFHGDHIGGLLDFPEAKFICLKKAYRYIQYKKGFSAIKNGFLPDLLPSNFTERVIFLDERASIKLSDKLAPYKEGWDVFQDGSIIAVDLSGHAVGQIGVFLKDQEKGNVFLCADACWQSRAYRERVLPNPLAYIIMPEVTSYKENIDRLHEFYKRHPDWKIIPTHCQEIWR